MQEQDKRQKQSNEPAASSRAAEAHLQAAFVEYGFSRTALRAVPAALRAQLLQIISAGALKPVDRNLLFAIVAEKKVSSGEGLLALGAIVARAMEVGGPGTRLLRDINEARIPEGSLQSLAAALGVNPGQNIGMNRARFVLHILRAVSKDQNTRKLLPQAIKILETHRGQFEILQEVLLSVSTDDLNIMKLPDRLRVEVPSADWFAEVALAWRRAKKPAEAGEAGRSTRVRSASGQAMSSDRGVLFCSRSEPGKAVPLGLVSAGSMFDTLLAVRAAKEEMEPAALERQSIGRQRKKASEILGQIELQELVNRPAIAEELGDRQTGDKARLLKDIWRLGEELNAQIGGMLSPEQQLEAKREIRKLRLGSDPGGRLLNWIERLGGQVPDEVRLAREMLKVQQKYPVVGEDEEAQLWKTIIYFKIHHTYIQSGLALQPFLEDLNYLDSLKRDDPLRERYKELLLRKNWLQTRLEKGALTLAEVGDVRSLPFARLRAEVGGAALRRSAEVLEYLEQKLSPLFLADGRQREDCRALTVPWERLQHHLYSKAFGVRAPDETPQAALRREDYQRAFNFIVFKQVNGGALDDFAKSISLPRLEGICEELCFIAAKLSVLETTLTEYETYRGHALFADESYVTAVETAAWKPRPILLLGERSDYGSAAEFEDLTLIGIPLAEMLRRVDARPGISGFPTQAWPAIEREVRVAAGVGYYPKRLELPLREIARKTISMTPIGVPDMKAALLNAYEISRNPLVRNWTVSLGRQALGAMAEKAQAGQPYYLLPREAQAVRKLASFYPLLRQAGLASIVEQEHGAWLGLEGAQVLRLVRDEKRPVVELDFVFRKLAQISLKEPDGVEEVSFTEPLAGKKALDSLLKELTGGSIIAAVDLPPGWPDKAEKYLKKVVLERIRASAAGEEGSLPVFIESRLVALLEERFAKSRDQRS